MFKILLEWFVSDFFSIRLPQAQGHSPPTFTHPSTLHSNPTPIPHGKAPESRGPDISLTTTSSLSPSFLSYTRKVWIDIRSMLFRTDTLIHVQMYTYDVHIYAWIITRCNSVSAARRAGNSSVLSYEYHLFFSYLNWIQFWEYNTRFQLFYYWSLQK